MELDYREWAQQFGRIGASLTEKQSLGELLHRILKETRQMTASDAGSIYRIDEEDDQPVLRFEEAQNDSVNLPERTFTLPLNRESLAGYVACEGGTLNIEDVYELPEDEPYSFSKSLDDELGYRTRSMLVLPLRNRDGEIKGVLQLINRKRDADRPAGETEIVPYPEEMTRMVEALASQAAVAMERAELESSVQRMLESIIQTLVTALDRRDQITTGHSQRLAEYARDLAGVLHSTSEGRFAETSFDDTEREMLYYAGLLHDIGKIAVPEDVLNKKNRLTDDQMETIRFRLAYIQSSQQDPDALSYYDDLREINESLYLPDERRELLEDLHDREFRTPEGSRSSWLTAEEYQNLSVRKGNLTEEELETIRSHPQATYDILQNIEWTEELESIPRIAAMHHEKLDGSGYPWSLDGEEIPLPARILSVVDIYEALTARDRPYKDSHPLERVKNILREEAESGKLDGDLVEVFFDQEVFRRREDAE